MDINKIIARVKAILMTPKTEWPVIAAEPATVPDLYKNYIVVLAAIPAVAGFIKSALGSGTMRCAGSNSATGGSDAANDAPVSESSGSTESTQPSEPTSCPAARSTVARETAPSSSSRLTPAPTSLGCKVIASCRSSRAAQVLSMRSPRQRMAMRIPLRRVTAQDPRLRVTQYSPLS